MLKKLSCSGLDLVLYWVTAAFLYSSDAVVSSSDVWVLGVTLRADHGWARLKVCSAGFYRLRQLRRVRRSLDSESAATLGRWSMPSSLLASTTVMYCWRVHRRLRLTSYSVSWMRLHVLLVIWRSLIVVWGSCRPSLGRRAGISEVQGRVDGAKVPSSQGSPVLDGLLHSDLRCGQSTTLLPRCASTQSQLVWASGICCCWPNCLELTEWSAWSDA